MRNFSDCWWICAQAELHFRSEWVNEEWRRQRIFHAQRPEISNFDPMKPYNSILLSGMKSSEGLQFWENNLKEVARNWRHHQLLNAQEFMTKSRTSCSLLPCSSD